MTAERHAFGLRLDGDLPVPGTRAPTGGIPRAAGRELRLQRASRTEVLAGWPAAGARDVSRRPAPSGRTASLIQQHDGAGLLLRLDGHGAYRLEPGARVAHCGLPARGAAWRWQRYVVGQVLPFAALLHGLEVLHAGAVARDGGAVAVTAPSGGGKSTLLAALVARGAPLVADDVVAAEQDGDGGVVVHPGPGLLSLREGGTAALGEAAARLGPPPGHGGPWRTVARAPAAVPLRALAVLRRDAGTRALEVARRRPAAAELLGATFNAAWQERGRLVRQLDLCAAIAATVPVLHVDAPLTASPDALAEALEEAVDAC